MPRPESPSGGHAYALYAADQPASAAGRTSPGGASPTTAPSAAFGSCPSPSRGSPPCRTLRPGPARGRLRVHPEPLPRPTDRPWPYRSRRCLASRRRRLCPTACPGFARPGEGSGSIA